MNTQNATQEDARKPPSLFRGTAVVGGLTAVSRLLGFFRDLLIARLLGAGMGADMFFVAFRIPNTLRSFFAEGALTSAFIPVFAEQLEQNREVARDFFRRILGIMLLLTGAVALLLGYWSEEIILLFAPGFQGSPGRVEESAHLLQIMLAYLPSITVVVIVNGVLTSLHQYGAGALAQVVVNICFILGAIGAGFLPSAYHVRTLAWSVFGAAVIQYLILIPIGRRVGFPPYPARPIWSAAAKSMFLLMLPALFGAAVYQLTILLNTLLASFLEPGSISWLFYADRLAQLPIGIFTIALSSVLLPELARGHARGDAQGADASLQSALRYSIFILAPVVSALAVAAPLLIEVLFQRGAFTERDTFQTAGALTWYAVALLPLSLYSVLSKQYIAKKRTIIPAIIGILVLILSLVTSLITMGPLHSSPDSLAFTMIQQGQELMPVHIDLGHVGLAISSAVAALASLVLAILFLEASTRKGVFRTLIRAADIYLGAGMVALGTYGCMLIPLGPIVQLTGIMVFPPLLYCLLLFATKNTEFQETFSLFRRYVHRG